jgi:hypothetical protein
MSSKTSVWKQVGAGLGPGVTVGDGVGGTVAVGVTVGEGGGVGVGVPAGPVKKTFRTDSLMLPELLKKPLG